MNTQLSTFNSQLSTANSHLPWLVLLTTDPKHTEYRLAQANMDEERQGHQPCFSLFVPYTLMSSDPAGREMSKTHFSLRSALRRYLFVKGDERKLAELMVQWNRETGTKTYFLRNASKEHARISEKDMETLKAACGNEQVRLDMPLLLRDLQPGKDISLTGTPFEIKDATYKVISIKRKRGGTIELQVELTLFNVTFQNLFVTYLDVADKSFQATLVTTAQKKLLDIFKRRVNGKHTEVTDHEDNKTLRSLFEKRDTPYPDGAMKRHFLALMLICSHLLGEEEATLHFLTAVQQELKDIAQLRESKAATNTRAYLHIATYIATGEPQYRQLAKTYVQKYNPSSTYLRQFVNTSAKHQARKHIGPKGRRRQAHK